MFGLSMDVWMGFIRHILTAVGGVFVALGWMDETMMLEVVGGAMTVIGFFASYWVKKDSA